MSEATKSEQKLLAVWQQHTYSEFVLRDAAGALETMTDNPYVLLVPISVGGQGRDGVRNFYANTFLPQLPNDLEVMAISQTITADANASGTIAEEAVFRFTHDHLMDWIAPGIPATSKRIEVAFASFIRFEAGKIASEHLYWDHATVLAQLGLIEANKLAVKGPEGANLLLKWADKA